MPKYDIRCLDCGNIWEVTLGMREEKAGLPCPECNSTHTQNYLGNTNMRVVFNGSGWAQKDLALAAIGAPPAVRENAYKKKVL